SLRFGPMKPVGLRDPRTGRRPWAVVQLRQDNALGTLWNIVGFQTKLKHGEQVRLFRTIPGLQSAAFARLGGLHRNTFLNSPRLLDGTLRLKARPDLRFAGQITGCEGYVESAARHDRDGRPAQPHHRWRRRLDLPADEREFRPVPADRGQFPRQGTQAGAGRPGARRLRPLAGPEPPRRRVVFCWGRATPWRVRFMGPEDHNAPRSGAPPAKECRNIP